MKKGIENCEKRNWKFRSGTIPTWKKSYISFAGI